VTWCSMIVIAITNIIHRSLSIYRCLIYRETWAIKQTCKTSIDIYILFARHIILQVELNFFNIKKNIQMMIT